jgi:hypothetical protein
VQCDELRTAVSDQQLRSDLSTALFIGGGALAVGGVVLFLVSSTKSGTSTRGETRIVPIATGREGRRAVSGDFGDF